MAGLAHCCTISCNRAVFRKGGRRKSLRRQVERRRVELPTSALPSGLNLLAKRLFKFAKRLFKRIVPTWEHLSELGPFLQVVAGRHVAGARRRTVPIFVSAKMGPNLEQTRRAAPVR